MQAGDIVTVAHRGYMLGSGKPKLPVLNRKRPDLTWQDVIRNWRQPASVARGTYFLSHTLLSASPNPTSILVCLLYLASHKSERLRQRRPKKNRGYWMINDRDGRNFFCGLAKEKGFDPLVADNWKIITKRHVVQQVQFLVFSNRHLLPLVRTFFREGAPW